MMLAALDSQKFVALIDTLLKRLFPLGRSLTGEGNRQTLKILNEVVELNLHEIKSGTQCYDWTIPSEWNIRAAWIKDSRGKKIVDFANSHLHVLNYSTPIHKKVSYQELKQHVHTLPKMPEAIPYRTSYYTQAWGFCLAEKVWQTLNPQEVYEVCIDSTGNPHGSLTYADSLVKGRSSKEYILSTYCCHPSLANDNLSGLVLATLLFKLIAESQPYHSYRLIIAPETIGVIAYLAQHEQEMKRVTGGFVITTVAGPGPLGYKRSFLHDSEIDFAALHALKESEFIDYPFTPDGSDERQYASPGFRIPTGTITKSKYYEYPEYHTSLDNLDFISAENLYQTLQVYWHAIRCLEMNLIFKRREDHCESMLGQYGLYPGIGGCQSQPAHTVSQEDGLLRDHPIAVDDQFLALSWLMFGCDGKTTIFEISRRSGMAVAVLFTLAQKMAEQGLLVEVER